MSTCDRQFGDEICQKKKEMLLCNVANCGDCVLVYMLISLIIMCFSLNFGYIVDTVAKIETGAANFLYFMQCHSFSGIFNTFFFFGNSNSPKS